MITGSHRHRQKNVSGGVMVNGRPRDLRAFRHDSVYIMQSEVLLEQLSVSEALYYSAALKLPSSVRSLLLSLPPLSPPLVSRLPPDPRH